MVRDDEASRYVWLDREKGALSSMPKNSIAIECSTLSPGWVRELAETARDTGIGFVDAPVAGSRPQAEAAQLVFFAGTDEATYHSVHPVLSSMGSVVHYCGPTGTGATIKLAVNALFAVQVATVAEVMGLLERTFPDLSKAFEIIGSTPVCSTAARLAGQAMLSRRFDPAFPIELVEKDLGYVESLALGVKAELPISSLTHQLMKNGISEGFGDDNITGIAQLYME